MKVEWTGFSGKLNMVYVRKGSRITARGSVQASGRTELPFYEQGRPRDVQVWGGEHVFGHFRFGRFIRNSGASR